MQFEDLKRFISEEDRWLRGLYGSYTDEEKRILARTVKMTEEAGELCNEVLANLSFQRKEKLDGHAKENLSHEFADVIITTLLLAEAMHVDVEDALTEKIAAIRKRQEAPRKVGA